jgi:hypothetical protein
MGEHFRSRRGTTDLLIVVAVLVGFGGTFYAAARLADSGTAGSSPESLSQLVGAVQDQLSSRNQEPQAAAVQETAVSPAERPAPSSTRVHVEVTSSGEIVSDSGIVSDWHLPLGRVPGVHALRTYVDPHVVAVKLQDERSNGHATAEVRTRLVQGNTGPVLQHTIIVRTYDLDGRLADRAFTLVIN